MADNEQRFGALHGRTPSAIAPSPAVRVRWQKETYVFINGAPAPRGMYRCRGVRRCLFVPVLQLSTQGSVRARIYTLKSVLAIDPSISRWLSLQVLLRSAAACPVGRTASKRLSALSLALPGSVNRGYFRSDGLLAQPEKKLAV